MESISARGCMQTDTTNHLYLIFSCEKLLETFEEAYVGKDPSNFPEDEYDKVFSDFPFTHSGSKVNIHGYMTVS